MRQSWQIVGIEDASQTVADEVIVLRILLGQSLVHIRVLGGAAMPVCP